MARRAMRLMFLFRSKHLNIFQNKMESINSRNLKNHKKPVLFHRLKFTIFIGRQRAWWYSRNFLRTPVIRVFSRNKGINQIRYQKVLSFSHKNAKRTIYQWIHLCKTWISVRKGTIMRLPAVKSKSLKILLIILL